MTNEEVGQRIKKARQQLGYTQSELAKKTGLAQQTIAKIERLAISRPRRLEALSKALECSTEWLMFGMHPPRWAIASDQEEIEIMKVPSKVKVIGTTKLGISKDEFIGYAEALSYDPEAYAVRVQGDEFTTVYREGTIIVCEPSRTIKPNDSVFCMKKDGGLLLGIVINLSESEVTMLPHTSVTPTTTTVERKDLESMDVIRSSWSPNSFIPN